jgi:cytosine/adenosine deaminase-related metal-dependent hydrolase
LSWVIERFRLRPRWVFPSDGSPIKNGLVEIEDGIVTALSANNSRRDSIDLPDVALIPGLVNAHTHLEFSHLTAPLTPMQPFAAWIRSVIAERGSRTSSVAESRKAGLAEIRRSGTVAVGEIATTDWPAEKPQSDAPPVVVFREVLGLSPDAVPDRMADLRRHLDLASSDASNVIRGASPHAPYSVHPALFEQIVQLASERAAPVAMHLAETNEELELLSTGTGPLVDLFRSMGIWRENVIPRGTRPLDYLRKLAELPQTLVIHGNYLDAEEQRFVAENPQLTLVICPQTHAEFGHAPHPLPNLLKLGARVAIGTDSRASSPTLNLWDDVRILRRSYPEVSPAALLKMATRFGAEALGMDDLGWLKPGKPATLTAIRLSDSQSTDPWRAIFGADAHPTDLATVLAGADV